MIEFKYKEVLDFLIDGDVEKAYNFIYGYSEDDVTESFCNATSEDTTPEDYIKFVEGVKSGSVDLKNMMLGDIIKEKALCLCDNIEIGFFECKICRFSKNQSISAYFKGALSRWGKEFIDDNKYKCSMEGLFGITCSGKNIKSHTVSKKKNFTKNKKWLEFKSDHSCKDGSNDLYETQIGTASTFNSICNKHDGVFKATDNGFFGVSYTYQMVYRQMLCVLYHKELAYNNHCKQFAVLISLCHRIKNGSIEILNISSMMATMKNLQNVIRSIIYEKDKLMLSLQKVLDLKLGIIASDNYLYFKQIDLKSDFEVNSSIIYTPRIGFDGSDFRHSNGLDTGDVYIFCVYNNGLPKLILACNKSEIDLVKFIDDFIGSDNTEEIFLKYLSMSSNTYYSEKFKRHSLSKLSLDNMRWIRNKYIYFMATIVTYISYETMQDPLFHNMESADPEDIERMRQRDLIKFDHMMFNSLELNKGIKIKRF